ncbi:MAG: hypothetical protein CVT74_06805 [Alphaproteobacteria bacterium HGW-Alphaproteobacteria-13]|jgi:hypothetical protein|nr:MAG: hypothetical protein CVT74_06805 [Alphaproteobacteria bacterium HGW-Alphaproteobacteria-13]
MTDDAMVPIAELLSRSEALTVAAMLDAAGIIVHVGGEYHSSVSPYIVALGGFRLTVPRWQYGDASNLIADMLAAPEPAPSTAMRRAVFRLFAASMGGFALAASPYVLAVGLKALLPVLLSPLFMAGVPVNPQGRGDYHLAAPSA